MPDEYVPTPKGSCKLSATNINVVRRRICNGKCGLPFQTGDRIHWPQPDKKIQHYDCDNPQR